MPRTPVCGADAHADERQQHRCNRTNRTYKTYRTRRGWNPRADAVGTATPQTTVCRFQPRISHQSYLSYKSHRSYAAPIMPSRIACHGVLSAVALAKGEARQREDGRVLRCLPSIAPADATKGAPNHRLRRGVPLARMPGALGITTAHVRPVRLNGHSRSVICIRDSALSSFIFHHSPSHREGVNTPALSAPSWHLRCSVLRLCGTSRPPVRGLSPHLCRTDSTAPNCIAP